MHFGKQLRFLSYGPWREQYIDFNKLKHIIKDIKRIAKEQGCIDYVDGPKASPSLSSLKNPGIELQTLTKSSTGGDKEEEEREEEKREEVEVEEEENIEKKKKKKKKNAKVEEEDNAEEEEEVVRPRAHKTLHHRRHHKGGNGDQKDEDKSLTGSTRSPDGADGNGVEGEGEGDEEEEDNRQEKVILNKELTRMFMKPFRKEKRRVNTFFQETVEACSNEIEDLQQSVGDIQAHREEMKRKANLEKKAKKKAKAKAKEDSKDSAKSEKKKKGKGDKKGKESGKDSNGKDGKEKDIVEKTDINGEDLTAVTAVTKKRFFDVLVKLEELVDYSRLNLVGFTKIMKKFVRETDFAKRDEEMEELRQSKFVTMVPYVEQLKEDARKLFVEAFLDVTDGEDGHALSPEEQAAQREVLLKEITQSVDAARSWKLNTILFEVDEHMRKVSVREKKLVIKPLPLIVGLVLLVLFYYVPMFKAEDRPAQRALGVLICTTVLWTSECMPLFATALLAVVLTITSSIVLDEASGKPLPASSVVKLSFKSLFSTSAPLVLAGFSISSAFKKYGIDIWIAMKALSNPLFKTPYRFLIIVEVFCFFMTMWISNVAATVLTLTVLSPIIRDLPKGCTYTRTLIMSTVLAGNIGGITTQIASLHNVVTLDLDDYSIDFVKFIICAFPSTPFLMVLGHILLITLFPPDVETLPDLAAASILETSSGSSGSQAAAAFQAADSKYAADLNIKKERASWKPVIVVVITALSIVLWIASSWLKPFGNSVGGISFIPLVLFYGTGLLGKEDFDRLPWNLIILLGGGNVLGMGIESSKLLAMITSIMDKVHIPLFALNVIVNVIMLIASTFIIHTISAIILLPIFAKLGLAMGHSKLLVMTSIVTCSGSNTLPVSSFPNLNAISLENEDKEPYVGSMEFLKFGGPLSIFCFIFSCTVTYGMCLALGF